MRKSAILQEIPPTIYEIFKVRPILHFSTFSPKSRHSERSDRRERSRRIFAVSILLCRPSVGRSFDSGLTPSTQDDAGWVEKIGHCLFHFSTGCFKIESSTFYQSFFRILPDFLIISIFYWFLPIQKVGKMLGRFLEKTVIKWKMSEKG